MRSIISLPKIKVFQSGNFADTITGGTTNIPFNRFERDDAFNVWDGAIFTNLNDVVREFLVVGAIYWNSNASYNIGFWKNESWFRRIAVGHTGHNCPFTSRILLGPNEYFSVRSEQSGTLGNYTTEGKRHYISIIEI